MVGRLLALSLGLIVGLATSQAPEFAQQYRQRLGGMIDALRLVVARFDENAAASNLSRDGAIARLKADPQPLVQGQGASTEEVVERLTRLERQRDAFTAAGPFDRLLVLVRDADPTLARATYLDFEPAWPATTEGLVAGGIGFVGGWGLLFLLFRSLGRLVPGRRATALSPRFRSA